MISELLMFQVHLLMDSKRPKALEASILHHPNPIREPGCLAAEGDCSSLDRSMVLPKVVLMFLISKVDIAKKIER